MQVKVTARHFEPRPSLHDAAVAAAESFDKFVDGIISVDVIMSLETETSKMVEFIMHVHGHTLVGRAETDDFFKSIAEASDNIERQIRKMKTKEHRPIRTAQHDSNDF
ncbi:MAG TPA: ribosome-associated translation inhibitor RaiA [Patescibacteria group bacterium]|nr:ribosome-associated translation inhibitor RaiA [Patescibacteria group bacterium]